MLDMFNRGCQSYELYCKQLFVYKSVSFSSFKTDDEKLYFSTILPQFPSLLREFYESSTVL